MVLNRRGVTKDFKGSHYSFFVNNFIRIIVNKIWQMLAAIKKIHTVDEKFLSIINSWVSKKNTARRATKGRAKINRE